MHQQKHRLLGRLRRRVGVSLAMGRCAGARLGEVVLFEVMG